MTFIHESNKTHRYTIDLPFDYTLDKYGFHKGNYIGMLNPMDGQPAINRADKAAHDHDYTYEEITKIVKKYLKKFNLPNPLHMKIIDKLNDNNYLAEAITYILPNAADDRLAVHVIKNIPQDLHEGHYGDVFDDIVEGIFVATKEIAGTALESAIDFGIAESGNVEAADEFKNFALELHNPTKISTPPAINIDR